MRKYRKGSYLLREINENFSLKNLELKIYSLLEKSRKPLKITEIAKELKVSERSVRTYVKRMLKRGLIMRERLEGRRLCYVYKAVSIEKILQNLHEKFNSILGKVKEKSQLAHH